jgi:hypothetical protein
MTFSILSKHVELPSKNPWEHLSTILQPWIVRVCTYYCIALVFLWHRLHPTVLICRECIIYFQRSSPWVIVWSQVSCTMRLRQFTVCLFNSFFYVSQFIIMYFGFCCHCRRIKYTSKPWHFCPLVLLVSLSYLDPAFYGGYTNAKGASFWRFEHSLSSSYILQSFFCIETAWMSALGKHTACKTHCIIIENRTKLPCILEGREYLSYIGWSS